MFSKTNITVNPLLIEDAKNSIPYIDFRLSINQPTGDFFYDPWKLKDEFKGTVWEEILNTLPYDKGEARLIKLDPGTCYVGHSDIDDRWHLSINAVDSYLVNLETSEMFKTEVDNLWHCIDAGVKHSAVNFSNKSRIQLVIRKLLIKGNIKDPVKVRITLKKVIEERRYIFDKILSPWLNKKNKEGLLRDFSGEDLKVEFFTEEYVISELSDLINEYFNIEILK
jgi:hypothetical protein